MPSRGCSTSTARHRRPGRSRKIQAAAPTAHAASDCGRRAVARGGREVRCCIPKTPSPSEGFADARFHSELPPDTEATRADSAAAGDADRVDHEAGVPTRPPADEPDAPLHACRRAGRALGASAPSSRPRDRRSSCSVSCSPLSSASCSAPTLAARWPATRPLLNALCGLAACKIEAPRRLDRARRGQQRPRAPRCPGRVPLRSRASQPRRP